jgi:hypothetical protein
MTKEQIDKALEELAALKKELLRIQRNGIIGSKVGRRIQEKKEELKELGVVL